MNRTVLGYGCLVLATLFWAGNAIVGRSAPDADIPPIGLNFWRWTFALVMFAPFAIGRLRRQMSLVRDNMWICVALGVAAVAGFNCFFYVALQYTTAVQGLLITAILPIFVLLGARVFLNQPITLRQLSGVIVSILGVVVIVGRGQPQVLLDLVVNIGDVWMLGAVALWAVQIILIRYLPKGADLVAFQIVAFVIGVIAMLPFYLWETWDGRPMPMTVDSLLFVGYTALMASVLGFTLWNLGVLIAGAKPAGYLANLFPIFGAALAILLLGEPFEWFHALGAMVILGGIYLATVTRPEDRPASRRV